MSIKGKKTDEPLDDKTKKILKFLLASLHKQQIEHVQISYFLLLNPGKPRIHFLRTWIMWGMFKYIFLVRPYGLNTAIAV